MKFFTINHSLCTSCNACLKVCPRNAINGSTGAYIIDYDKCVACGSCFKACKENAVKLDIPLEKINKAFHSLNELKSREEEVKLLTSENRSMSEKIKQDRFLIRNLVNNLDEAVVVIGEEKEIVLYNSRFVSLLDKKSRNYCQYQAISLSNKPIEELINQELFITVLGIYAGGSDVLWVDTTIGDMPTNVSVYSLRKGEAVMLVFRDIEDPKVAADIAVKQIESVIDKNMAMVNKIGFLLGEEVSETAKTLYQTIKTIDPRFDGK